LDRLLDKLWAHGLAPGFELMGNPGNLWTDFSTSQQVNKWHHLITLMARRYIDRYGEDWVATWRFETWNEPDHGYFCGINFSLETYLRYFDSSLSALKSVSPRLCLGGPGGSCRPPHFLRFCRGLLSHVQHGTNSFDPAIPLTLDFLSIHKKGDGGVEVILEEELATLVTLRRDFPFTTNIPVINDEADPLKGWWRGEEWRAGVEYAILVARNIDLHKKHFFDKNDTGIGFELLSNDNAFLPFPPNPFRQRSLLARLPSSNSSFTGSLFIQVVTQSVNTAYQHFRII